MGAPTSFISTQFFHIKMHPLFYMLITFILGITLTTFYSSAFLVIAITVLVIILYLHYSNFIPARTTKLYIINVVTFVIGGLNYSLTMQQFQALQSNLTTKPFDARVVINTITQTDHPRFKTRLTAAVELIRDHPANGTNPDAWKTCSTTLFIFIPDKTEVMIGDVIELHNVSTKKISNEAFGRYLFKEGAINTYFCDHFTPKLLQRPTWHLGRFLAKTRCNILERLQKKIPYKPFVLFASIFLGCQENIKKPMKHLKQQCKIWGISHYLARSGLHLVIILWVIQLLLCFIPCSFFLKQLIMLLIITGYWLLSWSSISFIRALLTFFFHKACLLLNFSGHFMYLLTLVCFGILLHNPLQLFFLDFQLTFGLTFALGLFNQIQSHKKLIASI